MIGFTDIMATFADLVGDDFPESATTDSRSFFPILKGRHPLSSARDLNREF